MSTVSTHILDIAHGTPAAAVPVTLEKQEGSDQWREIGSGVTDNNGRCAQLIVEGNSFRPGIYRLTFETSAYHAASGATSLYPFVQVVFAVREGETRFHIPLLLGPHGYTTYRGS